jgi:hypothetical protein
MHRFLVLSTALFSVCGTAIAACDEAQVKKLLPILSMDWKDQTQYFHCQKSPRSNTEMVVVVAKRQPGSEHAHGATDTRKGVFSLGIAIIEKSSGRITAHKTFTDKYYSDGLELIGIYPPEGNLMIAPGLPIFGVHASYGMRGYGAEQLDLLSISGDRINMVLKDFSVGTTRALADCSADAEFSSIERKLQIKSSKDAPGIGVHVRESDIQPRKIGTSAFKCTEVKNKYSLKYDGLMFQKSSK